MIILRKGRLPLFIKIPLALYIAVGGMAVIYLQYNLVSTGTLDACIEANMPIGSHDNDRGGKHFGTVLKCERLGHPELALFSLIYFFSLLIPVFFLGGGRKKEKS